MYHHPVSGQARRTKGLDGLGSNSPQPRYQRLAPTYAGSRRAGWRGARAVPGAGRRSGRGARVVPWAGRPGCGETGPSTGRPARSLSPAACWGRARPTSRPPGVSGAKTPKRNRRPWDLVVLLDSRRQNARISHEMTPRTRNDYEKFFTRAARRPHTTDKGRPQGRQGGLPTTDKGRPHERQGGPHTTDKGRPHEPQGGPHTTDKGRPHERQGGPHTTDKGRPHERQGGPHTTDKGRPDEWQRRPHTSHERPDGPPLRPPSPLSTRKDPSVPLDRQPSSCISLGSRKAAHWHQRNG